MWTAVYMWRLQSSWKYPSLHLKANCCSLQLDKDCSLQRGLQSTSQSVVLLVNMTIACSVVYIDDCS
jgi:hypothetical protein